MDITTANATTTASVKTPESEPEVPSRIQPIKPSSLTNGVLKRHHRNEQLNGPPAAAVTYKECLKNHAAAIGGHAVDGCGEFMPSPTASSADPTSLKCAACGCHRNFHRRDPEEQQPPPSTPQHVIEYQPQHRHHPPPPAAVVQRGGHSSPNSASPPPISSSYYPSAPHMLLALSAGVSGPQPENNIPTSAAAAAVSGRRKRFRSRFTAEQKQRMLEFAERIGWKMQKRDEESIADFCGGVGVERGVFKVWMHNHKHNNLVKRGVETDNNDSSVSAHAAAAAAAANGSSSSS